MNNDDPYFEMVCSTCGEPRCHCSTCQGCKFPIECCMCGLTDESRRIGKMPELAAPFGCAPAVQEATTEPMKFKQCEACKGSGESGAYYCPECKGDGCFPDDAAEKPA